MASHKQKRMATVRQVLEELGDGLFDLVMQSGFSHRERVALLGWAEIVKRGGSLHGYGNDSTIRKYLRFLEAQAS